MSHGLYHSNAPIVAVDEPLLMRQIESTKPGGEEKKLIQFTHKIGWLREVNAQVVYVHGGRVLKEGSSYNDYFGFLTCLNQEDGSVAAALRVAHEFGVGTASSLEIAVRTDVMDRPVCFSGNPDVIAYNESGTTLRQYQYELVPGTWRYWDEEICDAWHNAAIHDRKDLLLSAGPIIPKTIINQEVVWTSKLGEAENRARLDSFLTELRRKTLPIAFSDAAANSNSQEA